MDRNKQIVRTSLIGIAANAMLVAFKIVIGMAAQSIAIIMDAINNLSDVLSSVITIIGTKLSEKPADHEHPFGHGRIEYFTAIIIAILVLMAGITSCYESVMKIIEPNEPSYTTATLVVIIAAIAVKILLGLYVKRTGEKLNSDALIASGADALFDAIVTLATLISAGIMLIWNINLDGIFGVLISIVIIKAGIEMLSSPINELLGSRISPEFVSKLKNDIMEFEEVKGVYDIIMNNYGHDVIIGSLHINVSEAMTAKQIHRLTREISKKIYEKHGVILTIGIYASHDTTTSTGKLQQAITQYALTNKNIIQVHGFFYYEEKNLITIDIVPTDDVTDKAQFSNEIGEDLKKKFPGYSFSIIIDQNYSE